MFTPNFQKKILSLGKFWFSSVVLKSIIFHLCISYTSLSLLLKFNEIDVCPKHNVFLPLFSLLLGFSGWTFLLFFWGGLGFFLPVYLGELSFSLCGTHMIDILWNRSYFTPLFLSEGVQGI